MRALGRQFFRYSLVGLATNIFAYLAYLALTATVLTPKIAMTITYLFAVGLAFVFNRGWTFAHRGASYAALARHLTAYASGYVVNWVALAVFVDLLQFRHQVVQGCMIIVLAIMLFLVQRYWVFAAEN